MEFLRSDIVSVNKGCLLKNSLHREGEFQRQAQKLESLFKIDFHGKTGPK